MTRKIFEFVASIFSYHVIAIDNKEYTDHEKWIVLYEYRSMIYHFCDKFIMENPKFNRSKFIEKTGIEEKLNSYIPIT